MTLLVAGHETTASELAWAFERLAREPDVLARLVDEIDAGDGDAYLTATIQETLRRRPVLPNAAPRLVKQPVEIGGWNYPPGVCLVANAYLVHHDPDDLPRPVRVPARALPRRAARHLHVDPVRRRPPPLPRRELRDARDEDRAARGPVALRGAAGDDGAEVSRRRAITLSPNRRAPPCCAIGRRYARTGVPQPLRPSLSQRLPSSSPEWSGSEKSTPSYVTDRCAVA